MSMEESEKEYWLVCGTQIKGTGYCDLVNNELDRAYYARLNLKERGSDWKPTILEGCCLNSADVFAELWAKKREIPIEHYPAQRHHHLKRNIEMVARATKVYAFWNLYSYGTAHTIAHAVMKGIPIRIIRIK